MTASEFENTVNSWADLLDADLTYRDILYQLSLYDGQETYELIDDEIVGFMYNYGIESLKERLSELIKYDFSNDVFYHGNGEPLSYEKADFEFYKPYILDDLIKAHRVTEDDPIEYNQVLDFLAM